MREKVIELIFAELAKAETKFPGWPFDVVHGAAILGEEAGELTQAALDFYYSREMSIEKMRKEAAQVGAMAIRFLVSLAEDHDGIIDSGTDSSCGGPEE